MEYESSRSMPAGKKAAFDVASDVERMSEWLPTTVQVSSNDDGTVHVEGDSDGGHYSAEGLLRAQQDQLRMEWGSEDDGRYAGWLQVTGIEDDASEAVLHLSFLGEQPAAREHDERVAQGIDEALERLAAAVARRT